MKPYRILLVCAIFALAIGITTCDDTHGNYDDEHRKICTSADNPDACKYLRMFKDTPESIDLYNPVTNKIIQSTTPDILPLFDSDITSIFKAESTSWLRFNYDRMVYPRRIRINGNTSYKVNFYYLDDSDKVLVPSLSLTDQTLLDSWNSFDCADIIKTRTILLEIIPGEDINNGIKEIEIWNGRAPTDPKDEISLSLGNIDSVDVLNDNGICKYPYIKKFSATPDDARFYNYTEKKKTAVFTINIPIDPALFKRAVIKYRAIDFTTPVSIERSINNLSWSGGYSIKYNKTQFHPVKDLFEEINPSWLVKGKNTIQFRLKEIDKSAAIQDLDLIVETDNGWNYLSSSSYANVYDGDTETYDEIYTDTYGMEFKFERTIEPEAIMIHVNGGMGYTGTVQYLSNYGWSDVNSQWQIDFSTMKQGWNAIVVPTAIQTTSLRLMLHPASNSSGALEAVQINEIRFCGSPVNSLNSQPRIVISYPRNGEYYGRTAYIQGFVTPQASAIINIEGKNISPDIQDNSFSTSLTKDETRFKFQSDDQPWTPIITTVQPGINNSKELYLFDNVLSTSGGSSSGGDQGSDQNGGSSSCHPKYNVRVYPDRPSTITYGDVTLKIPAGAVSETVTITIQPLSKSELARINPGMVNVTYPAAGYRFLANGKAHYTFLKAIQISVPFSRDLLLNGMSDNSVFMYYYGETEKMWKRLRRIGISDSRSSRKIGIVTSETNHFTDMINGTITVPEQPDPLMYNPNSIKDIKTGDPAAGVNLIEPPAPNNKGEARLSYPIEVPPGRNGMQPQVAITYNSEQHNGWLGWGWDIPLDAIVIDTRFGVPRYDGNETYLLYSKSNNTQLAAIGDDYFRARVEGNFVKIKRHGASCNSYWWEVIDKNGTRYFYGKTDNSRLKNYRNTDGSIGGNGNISIWYLEKVIDSNNNNIKYTYFHDFIDDPDEPSVFVYLNKITYTGTGDADGKYSIVFHIDNTQERIDKQVACRAGFKEEMRYLLKSIDVMFNSSVVRKYNINYKIGIFNKNLIQKVEQYDSTGILFNAHEFEYFDDITSNTSESLKGFSDIIDADNEKNLSVGSLGFIKGDYARVGAIEGSKSLHTYRRYSVLAGHHAENEYGFIRKEHHEQESEVLLKIFDIDGDGLNDQVFADNGKIYYCKNNGLIEEKISFNPPVEIDSLNGKVSSIEHDKGESDVTGWFVFVPQEKSIENPYGFPLINGDPNTKSNSDSVSYFEDVNGDGLRDLVVGDIVYYSTLDNIGKPVFSQVRPIGFGSDSDMIYTANKYTQEDNEELKKLYHLDDPILMWEAPFDGDIAISGKIQRIRDTYIVDDSSVHGTNDGLVVSIKKNNEPPIFENSWNKFTHEYDLSNRPVFTTVQKGDKIYFRVNSKDEGSYDSVSWNPKVEYINSNYDTSLNDENNLPVFKYNLLDDFLCSETNPTFTAHMDGIVDFSGIINKTSIFSDDIEMRLYITDDSGEKILVQSLMIPAGETGEIPVEERSINVSVNDVITCELRSDTEIDWAGLNFNPVIVYNSVDGLETVVDENGNPLYKYDIPINIKFYPIKDSEPVVPFVAPKDGRIRIIYEAQPIINSIPSDYRAEVTLAVKRVDNLLVKQKGVIDLNEDTQQDGVVDIDQNNDIIVDYEMNINAGDKLYFTCASSREDFTTYIQLGVPLIYYESDNGINENGRINTTNSIDAMSQVYRMRDEKYNYEGGYRSWYYGRWNGNITDLDQNKMKILDITQIEGLDEVNYEEKMSQFEEQTKTFSPMTRSIMQPLRKYVSGKLILREARPFYLGLDKNCFIGKSTVYDFSTGAEEERIIISSTRVIRRYIPPYSNINEGIYKSFEYRGAIKTSNKSSSISDFIDINGDGYPDYVFSNGIQFTKPDGTLDDYKTIPLNPIRSMNIHSDTKYNLLGHYSNSDYTINGIFGFTKDTINIERAKDIIDINGDGLPDIIKKYYSVPWQSPYGINTCLNNGYGFSTQNLPLSAQSDKSNFSKISMVSVKDSEGMIPYLGVFKGIFSTGNILAEGYEGSFIIGLHDLNGDGLNDLVKQEGNEIKVYLNNGIGFNGSSTDHYVINSNNIGEYSGITRGLQVISFGWWHYYDFLVVAVHEAGKDVPTLSKTKMQIVDINGDDLPDIIKTDDDGEMIVHLNMTGRTNLLKKIVNPLGGTIDINYEKMTNTVDMPKSKWVMSSVTVNDGNNNDYETKYSYTKGFYDKKEREFYGFKTIEEIKPDGSLLTRVFHNNDYYLKGSQTNTMLKDQAGRLYISTAAEYGLNSISEKIKYPYLVAMETAMHEGNDGIAKVTSQTYEYDAWGNVVHYTDNGDDGIQDNLDVVMTYKYNESNYIMNRPRTIKITGGDEKVYRQRTADYDDSGNLISVIQSIGDGREAVTSITYTDGGNIQSITGPNGYARTFTYDSYVKTHLASISDGTYTSYVNFTNGSIIFGKPSSQKDISGSEIGFTYDSFGRLQRVTDPGLNITHFTITYPVNLCDPIAVAENIVYESGKTTPLQTLTTTTKIDGLKRAIQTTRKAEVNGSSCTVSSGGIQFDAMGRIVREGQPYIVGSGSGFDNETLYTYDVLNRPTNVENPDSTSVTYQYGFENNQFRTIVTDQMGNTRRIFKDIKNNIKQIKQYDADLGVITTSYTYNPIGDITAVIDSKGNRTAISYDNMGRRTSIDNPDTGLIEYAYNTAGNITGKTTPVLRMQGKSITYTYSQNRLKQILFPDSGPVIYDYGQAGTEGAGRIVRIESPGVIDEFTYGKLGEVKKNKRSIRVSIPADAWIDKTTEYSYDTLGRMISLTFPDQEIIAYQYDTGGLLNSVRNTSSGIEYVKNIDYNINGQRTRIEYGNGAISTYNYEDDTHRLTGLATQSAGQQLQNLAYEYDNAGNITRKTNNSFLTPGGETSSTQNYLYNNLHWLVSAEGDYENDKGEREYTSGITYDTIGNIKTKNQNATLGGAPISEISYNYDYQYTGSQPHAVTSTGVQNYIYDSNGNMKSWSASSGGLWMQFDWDEENRLKKTMDEEGTVNYKYDTTGKRIVKRSDSGEVVYYNDNYTIRGNDVFSKHIFAGNTRVATILKTASTEDAVYYYHGDHLGSSSVVTNNTAAINENIEYFPYGETWVQEKASASQGSMPYKFTSKELDVETGLYYYGTRYYDPKGSRWLGTDPALERYLPGISEGNDKLPGMGGVFNVANLDVYNFTNNNPVKMIDPDGNEVLNYIENLFGYALSSTFMSSHGADPRIFWGPSEHYYNLSIKALSNAYMIGDVLTTPGFYGIYLRGTFGPNFFVPGLPISPTCGLFGFIDTNKDAGITGRIGIKSGDNLVGVFGTQYLFKNGKVDFSYNVGSGANIGNVLLRNTTNYENFEIGGKLSAGFFGVEGRLNPNTMIVNFSNFFSSNASFYESYLNFKYDSGGGSSSSIYFGSGIKF